MSLDSASKLGYYDLKWYIMATPWARVLQGHAVMDLSSADIAAAEMIVTKIEGDSLGEVTHLYNGTFTLNPATRSVHTRSAKITIILDNHSFLKHVQHWWTVVGVYTLLTVELNSYENSRPE